MTCREKLFKDYPKVRDHNSFFDWNKGCPHHYGYAAKPRDADGGCCMNCIDCWDREIEEGVDIPNDVVAYRYNQPKEPLILEPEDWSDDEWATITKLFGMKEADRIMVSDYTLETYGIPYTGDEIQ